MGIKLRYIGTYDSYTVPLPSGIEVDVKHGEVASFPTELARRLLDQQANFIRANAEWGEEPGQDDPEEEAELDAAQQEIARREAARLERIGETNPNPDVEHPGETQEENS